MLWAHSLAHLAAPLLLYAPPAVEPDPIKELEKQGAVVTRDHARPGRPVVELVLGGPRTTDDSLKKLSFLKELRQLRVLNLTGARITDDGLAALQRLAGLERLILNSTPVTDAGLKHLTGLRNLNNLQVIGTRVTEEGAASLKESLPETHIVRVKIVPRPFGRPPFLFGRFPRPGPKRAMLP
jgi:hypothetical protein